MKYIAILLGLLTLHGSGAVSSAIENYSKSLALDPENENAREVLKRLQGK